MIFRPISNFLVCRSREQPSSGSDTVWGFCRFGFRLHPRLICIAIFLLASGWLGFSFLWVRPYL